MPHLSDARLLRCQEILATLVAFPTLTDGPNLDLIAWCEAHLTKAGFTTRRLTGGRTDRAGLLATFGGTEGAVIWSAHSDVVPVAGQAWSRDPFTLHSDGIRLSGRGTTDMKGFLACCLTLAEEMRGTPPARPLAFVISYDEEVGVRGIAEMLPELAEALPAPALCIVGEPTQMQVVTAHKGKAGFIATATGDAGHSSLAPAFHNALHGICDFVQVLRDLQADLRQTGPSDPAFDPPFATVHTGILRGGEALNIVPSRAEAVFEIRHLAGQNPADLIAGLTLPERVSIAQTGAYPALSAEIRHPEIARLLTLTEQTQGATVSYGTEAGYYAGLGIPTVVCGPGTMADGHQPDESIALSELADCLTFLARVAATAAPAAPEAA